MPLSDGVRVNGTFAGASLDHPICDDFFGPDADVAYVFTVTEATGVVVTAGGSADTIISVVDSADCELPATPEPDRTCIDQGFDGDGEEVRIGELLPGTYFIVLGAFGGFGSDDFTIQVDFVAPFCTGDAADVFVRGGVTGNETPEDALTLAPGFATGNFDSLGAIALSMCEGDVDYWLIGHLGGALTAAAITDGASTFELFSVNLDVEATKETNSLTYTENVLVQTFPIEAVDVPAGFYLIKGTEQADLVGAQRVRYSFSVSHACVGDDFDVPDAELDRFFELQAEPIVLPGDVFERNVCAADVDYFMVEALFDGELKAIIGGEHALDVNVEFFAVAEDGTETQLTRNRTEVDGTAEFTATATRGQILARVDGSGFIETRSYTLSLVPPGLDGPPANSTCETAETLLSGEAVDGRTVGGADSVVPAPCSDAFFEDDAFADVFYRFSVSGDPTDTQVSLENVTDYTGTFGIFQLPGGTCPSTPDGFTVVAVNGDACGGGFFGDTVISVPQLPVGDYVVIVEDSFSDDAGGLFRVTMEQFPDGFPPPPLCEVGAIRELVMPAIGESTVENVVAGDFLTGTVSDWGPLCSASGGEVAYALTASQAATLTIETEFSADTVLAVMRGTCSEAAVDTCDDDGGEGVNSLIITDIAANETIFIALDLFSAETGEGTLTVQAAAP